MFYYQIYNFCRLVILHNSIIVSFQSIKELMLRNAETTSLTARFLEISLFKIINLQYQLSIVQLFAVDKQQ